VMVLIVLNRLKTPSSDELFCTVWGIKISHFSKGHCEGCIGGREVGVVSCGWLASTVVSNHNGLDR